MSKHILTSVAVLLNSVVAIIPAWSKVPVGVRIDGDVLVKWPVEYRGKAVVPDGVHHIADRAFMDCKGVTDVVFPNGVGVQTIGENAFSRCFGLTDVSIPKSVTNIGNSAFFFCWNLTNLTIKAEVRGISRAMCLRCVRLERVEFPEKLLDIGAESFLSCRSLKAAEVPNGVTNISDKAFAMCSNLEKVEISNGLMSIGDRAFAWCYNLEKVNGLARVCELGKDVFLENGLYHRKVGIAGLARVIRLAAEGFSLEGPDCRVDLFAMDRLAAHAGEVQIGMSREDVDGVIRRLQCGFGHGIEATIIRFGLSRNGSVGLRLKYRHDRVSDIELTESFKLGAVSGAMVSDFKIDETERRWL